MQTPTRSERLKYLKVVGTYGLVTSELERNVSRNSTSSELTDFLVLDQSRRLQLLRE